MKQLSGAVCDLASEVVSVLRDGDHHRAVAGVASAAATGGEDQAVGVAAVRVLGADVLLPSTLFRRPPAERDVALVREAVRTFPPGNDASISTRWSHWAMEQALHRYDQPDQPGQPDQSARPDQSAGPDASWIAEVPWQQLTHQLAVLGALAVPSTTATASRVTLAAARRPVDLARGFVRAVRRRDWLQAAGAGRWLAVIDGVDSARDAGDSGVHGSEVIGVPDTLGLDAGLEFVLRMGGADPRVALHAHAAQLLRHGREAAA